MPFWGLNIFHFPFLPGTSVRVIYTLLFQIWCLIHLDTGLHMADPALSPRWLTDRAAPGIFMLQTKSSPCISFLPSKILQPTQLFFFNMNSLKSNSKQINWNSLVKYKSGLHKSNQLCTSVPAHSHWVIQRLSHQHPQSHSTTYLCLQNTCCSLDGMGEGERPKQWAACSWRNKVSLIILYYAEYIDTTKTKGQKFQCVSVLNLSLCSNWVIWCKSSKASR